MRSTRFGLFISIWLLHCHWSSGSSPLSQFNCRYPSTNVDGTIYLRKKLMKKSTPPFIFSSPVQCECEHDWMDAFCLRVDHYRKASADAAPAICICRRLSWSGGSTRKCTQFLVRCFADNRFSDAATTASRNDTRAVNAAAGHAPPQRCACCFNQPDEFCGHVECAGMRPIISEYSNDMSGGGGSGSGRSEYSCVCMTQTDYPYTICGGDGRPSADHAVNTPPRLAEVTPMSRVVANSFRAHDRRIADGGPLASASLMTSPDQLRGGGVALVASVAATLAVLTAFGCFLSAQRISCDPRLKTWYHRLRARLTTDGNDDDSAAREYKKSQMTPSVEPVGLSVDGDGDTIGRSSSQPPAFFTMENNTEMLLV